MVANAGARLWGAAQKLIERGVDADAVGVLFDGVTSSSRARRLGACFQQLHDFGLPATDAAHWAVRLQPTNQVVPTLDIARALDAIGVWDAKVAIRFADETRQLAPYAQTYVPRYAKEHMSGLGGSHDPIDAVRMAIDELVDP